MTTPHQTKLITSHDERVAIDAIRRTIASGKGRAGAPCKGRARSDCNKEDGCEWAAYPLLGRIFASRGGECKDADLLRLYIKAVCIDSDVDGGELFRKEMKRITKTLGYTLADFGGKNSWKELTRKELCTRVHSDIEAASKILTSGGSSSFEAFVEYLGISREASEFILAGAYRESVTASKEGSNSGFNKVVSYLRKHFAKIQIVLAALLLLYVIVDYATAKITYSTHPHSEIAPPNVPTVIDYWQRNSILNFGNETLQADSIVPVVSEGMCPAVPQDKFAAACVEGVAVETEFIHNITRKLVRTSRSEDLSEDFQRWGLYPGQMIYYTGAFVDRSPMAHYAVYVHNGIIAETGAGPAFCGRSSTNMNANSIGFHTLQDFSERAIRQGGEQLTIVSTIADADIPTMIERLNRIPERLGVMIYNPIVNNCEHFANMVVLGSETSYQTRIIVAASVYLISFVTVLVERSGTLEKLLEKWRR